MKVEGRSGKAQALVCQVILTQFWSSKWNESQQSIRRPAPRGGGNLPLHDQADKAFPLLVRCLRDCTAWVHTDNTQLQIWPWLTTRQTGNNAGMTVGIIKSNNLKEFQIN